MMACFALQPLQQSAARYLRRNRKEQMHMILRHMPLHYLYFVLPANVTDQVAHSHRYISRQRRPSVLRDPHQMQMNLKYRVRAPSVFWHPLSLPAARLLKPSPVRRRLHPSQTGTVNGLSNGATKINIVNTTAALAPCRRAMKSETTNLDLGSFPPRNYADHRDG